MLPWYFLRDSGWPLCLPCAPFGWHGDRGPSFGLTRPFTGRGALVIGPLSNPVLQDGTGRDSLCPFLLFSCSFPQSSGLWTDGFGITTPTRVFFPWRLFLSRRQSWVFAARYSAGLWQKAQANVGIRPDRLKTYPTTTRQRNTNHDLRLS